jgi:hypothetical protein
MKTIKQLKKLINYAQTDDVFREYLKSLESAGVITINSDDITEKNVGDDFYERVANVFGIQLDADLNPVLPDAEGER